MRAVFPILHLFLFAHRGLGFRVKCGATGDDSACTGTIDSPCNAKVEGYEVGSLAKLRYIQTQAPTAATCNPIGGPKDCEGYEKTIYVSVGQGAPENGWVELTENGMFAVCYEACQVTTANVFNGVCQDPGTASDSDLGCVIPASAADLCAVDASELMGVASTIFPIGQVGSCDSSSSWSDQGLACNDESPCEVKILDYKGDVGDVVLLDYSQGESNYPPSSNYCAGDVCDLYENSIVAKVVQGDPVVGGVELSPTALKSLCAGACLESVGGVFTGLCQQIAVNPADGTECVNAAADDDDVCGVVLRGPVLVSQDPTTTTAPEPPSTATVPPTTAPETAVSSIGSTSDSVGVVGAAGLCASLFTVW